MSAWILHVLSDKINIMFSLHFNPVRFVHAVQIHRNVLLIQLSLFFPVSSAPLSPCLLCPSVFLSPLPLCLPVSRLFWPSRGFLKQLKRDRRTQCWQLCNLRSWESLTIRAARARNFAHRAGLESAIRTGGYPPPAPETITGGLCETAPHDTWAHIFSHISGNPIGYFTGFPLVTEWKIM
jgi:hypothetical protein